MDDKGYFNIQIHGVGKSSQFSNVLRHADVISMHVCVQFKILYVVHHVTLADGFVELIHIFSRFKNIRAFNFDTTIPKSTHWFSLSSQSLKIQLMFNLLMIFFIWIIFCSLCILSEYNNSRIAYHFNTIFTKIWIQCQCSMDLSINSGRKAILSTVWLECQLGEKVSTF